MVFAGGWEEGLALEKERQESAGREEAARGSAVAELGTLLAAEAKRVSCSELSCRCPPFSPQGR